MSKIHKYSLEFGKKEKVLNYTCRTYQLSRPNNVGAVMALIRECQPQSIEEWEIWYFDNAYTSSNNNVKITKDTLRELGERLYSKITSIVIPEWTAAFNELTIQDCCNYIYNLTINRTYDGYIREKSVIYDGLANIFPNIIFEESEPELDHSGDVDFIGRIGKMAIGVQIKPTTAKSNFGNYSISERMRNSFDNFSRIYHGKVFIIYSLDGEIANPDMIEEIKQEIERLSSL